MRRGPGQARAPGGWWALSLEARAGAAAPSVLGERQGQGGLEGGFLIDAVVLEDRGAHGHGVPGALWRLLCGDSGCPERDAQRPRAMRTVRDVWAAWELSFPRRLRSRAGGCGRPGGKPLRRFPSRRQDGPVPRGPGEGEPAGLVTRDPQDKPRALGPSELGEGVGRAAYHEGVIGELVPVEQVLQEVGALVAGVTPTGPPSPAHTVAPATWTSRSW